MDGFMVLNATTGTVLVHDCTPEFSLPEDPLAFVQRMAGPLFAFHQIAKDLIDVEEPENRASFSALHTEKVTLHIGYTFISQTVVVAVIFLPSHIFGLEKDFHNLLGENLANICCTTFSSSIQEVGEALPKKQASEFCTEFAEACKVFIPRFICERMSREVLRALKVQPSWVYILEFGEDVPAQPKANKPGIFSQFFKSNKKKQPEPEHHHKRSNIHMNFEYISVFSTLERPNTRTGRLQAIIEKLESYLTSHKDNESISVLLTEYSPIITPDAHTPPPNKDQKNYVMIFVYKRLIICIPYYKESILPENEEQAVVMVQKWVMVSYHILLWATRKT